MPALFVSRGRAHGQGRGRGEALALFPWAWARPLPLCPWPLWRGPCPCPRNRAGPGCRYVDGPCRTIWDCLGEFSISETLNVPGLPRSRTDASPPTRGATHRP